MHDTLVIRTIQNPPERLAPDVEATPLVAEEPAPAACTTQGLERSVRRTFAEGNDDAAGTSDGDDCGGESRGMTVERGGEECGVVVDHQARVR